MRHVIGRAGGKKNKGFVGTISIYLEIIRRKLIYNQIFKLPFALCRWIGSSCVLWIGR